MKEIWKDIPNYEGLYQASNLGRVKSLDRKVWNGWQFYFKKGRILKPTIHMNYFRVCLSKNNEQRSLFIHQLLAMAFLGHIPCGTNMVCDHINNNPLDNRVENIQLLSIRANTSKDKKGFSSKYTGVSWVKSRNKWHSNIRIKGKKKYLGAFDNELEASEAYKNKLKTITK